MEEEYSDERLEEICGEVYGWEVEFSQSKYYQELTQEQKQESESIVMSFTEYMYSYLGLPPEDWDEEGVEECCLEILPGKVTADETYYKSVAPVLSAFFTFTEDKGLLKNSSRLAQIVRQIDKRMVKKAADPRNWGVAKSSLMRAKSAGVNIEDEEEVKKFIAQSNLEKATKPGAGTTHKTKIGRNDPCPCGSGKKYKNCCGKEANKPAPPLSPPDRRLMERDWQAIQKLLEGHDFESVDEMNDYLRQVIPEGNIPEWTPETPAEQAQELIYRALEATKRKDRIRLAMEALNVYQDCADAYVLLAEEAAEMPEQAKNWYQRGMEAGERILGPEIFSREVGNFWGIIETRPYMRAREGLADCLSLLGEHEVAIGHYRDMLRLNPGDNQGIRYKLLSCLMESSDIDAARELLGQYQDEPSAAWLFTQALVAFINQGDSQEARKQLQEAMEFNPHVAPYLLGRRRMPRTLPDYIGFGDKNEAVAYVADFGDNWRDTPGVLKWLKSRVP